MSDKRTPNIVATAPERIYLVIGEDVDKSTDFADLCGEGITWCEDKIDGNSIEYVRADKNAEPIGYIYSNNGVKVGAINRYDVPNGTPLYTHPPESRVAELEAALRIASDALVPLQNAHLPIEREMLTDEDVKNAADAISTIIAALAGNPAPRLTDDDFLQIIFSCGSELQDRKALTYDSGPYEVSTLTAAGSRLCRAIEAKVRGE